MELFYGQYLCLSFFYNAKTIKIRIRTEILSTMPK